MTNKRIDLYRKEKRFFIPAIFTNAVMDLIKEVKLVPVKYSDKPITQTVYLLDDEQTWSLGISLKARRYLKKHPSAISLEKVQRSAYRLEVKKEVSMETRRKKRERFGQLQKAAQRASNQFPGIRPYLVIEYRRQHFVPHNADYEFRVTVDTETRFWFFPPDKSEAIVIKNFGTQEDIVRLEIKLDPAGEIDDLVANFLNQLSDLGAQPAISKKQEGLNTVKMWIDKTYANPLIKELKNVEIESKLTVRSDIDPNILFVTLKEFCKIATKPIILDPNYPFTITTSSVNHYWGSVGKREYLKEGVKILSRGVLARPVYKSDTRKVNSQLGIVERKEVKGEHFSCVETPFSKIISQEESRMGKLTYAGFLFRTRKAIWLLNELSGRIYHLSLDKCSASNKFPLYQIEIEYSGMLQREGYFPLDYHKARREIIRDTKFLAKQILTFAKNRRIVLVPGEEKFVWLISS
jgi:hypothetical protein